MEQVTGFGYSDCVQLKQEDVPSEVASEVAAADDDHIYNYIAMREPDPAKDAQPVALACYPQFAYAYPPQQQITAQITQPEPVEAPKPAAPVMAMAQPVFAYAAQPAYAYAYAMPNYPVPVYSSSPKIGAAVKASAPASETKKKTTASATETKKVTTSTSENKKATVSATTGTKKVVTKVSAKVETSGKIPKSEKSEKVAKVDKATKIWVGRTKKQVDEDNIKIALNEGIYNPNEIIPKDAKPDQLFWVVEIDGTNTLRTFQTIELGVLGKGVWKIDPRYGNAYFVRAKEEKEKEMVKEKDKK